MLGSWEIILIIFFILVLFGPNKILVLFKNLRIGIQTFKSTISNMEETKTKE